MKNRRKAANSKFQKNIASPAKVKEVFYDNISDIILKPEIYSIISEFTIHFRLINWRLPLEDQYHAKKFVIELFLPKIQEKLYQLKIFSGQINGVLELCQSLMSELVKNPAHNAGWGTTWLVSRYRNAGLYEMMPFRNFFNDPYTYRAAYVKDIYPFRFEFRCLSHLEFARH